MNQKYAWKGGWKSVYGKDRIASTIFITSSCYKWSRWAKVSLQLLLGGVLPLWHLINLLFNMLTTQGTTALSLALPSLNHPSATLAAPRINRWHCLTIATMIKNWLSGVLFVTFCKNSNGWTSAQDLIKFDQKQMFNVNFLSVIT